ETLSAGIFTLPIHGTLALTSDGSFTYPPNANFHGTDTFSYRATDGTANSNVGTVQITINPVNDAPVGANDTYSTLSGATLTIPANGVLTNDTDVDGDTLTATTVTNPAHGTLNLSTNGGFTYTPAGGFVGTDTFTYQANDGTTNSGPVTVTIQVNPSNTAPVSVNDAYSIGEDGVLTVTSAAGVLSNDTDADGDTLTASFVALPQHGSLALNTDGSFTYTPVANFNGTDSFTYHANDGSVNGNTATVNLTINAVNDLPVSLNDAYTIAEDGVLAVPAAGGVLSNDTDAEGNTLTAGVVSLPQHGTLSLNTDGSFTYTPVANFNGTDSFTYRANDGTGNGNTATVNLTITAVNDAPVGTSDTYSTTQGVALIVPAAGVLTNDTDVDGNSLTATTVTNPTHGTLALNSNGSFTYTPTAGFTGGDSFTYQANDGTTNSGPVTVTIQVNAPANTPPVSANDAYTVNEDNVLTVAAGQGVLVNDTDVDGNALTATIVSLPAHGTVTLNADGSFTYTPAADFNGSDSFTYHANDGTVNGNTATVNLTVNPQGEAPVVTTTAGHRTVKGHRKLVLDPGANVTDADSTNFGGGNIRVAILNGDGSVPGARDQLTFLRGGANRGRVNIHRGDLRVGKVVVGTYTGGLNGAPLQIELNSNATIERVRTVLQNIIFRGTTRHGGPRIVTIQVTDETHLASNIATKTVDVT
ncbi:MAG: outer rane adhesin like protein, partial [Planctomycetaceae bacterium]|nr:outer rane adhesin like protein [Planctomycetaceae bacterium]